MGVGVGGFENLNGHLAGVVSWKEPKVLPGRQWKVNQVF